MESRRRVRRDTLDNSSVSASEVVGDLLILTLAQARWMRRRRAAQQPTFTPEEPIPLQGGASASGSVQTSVAGALRTLPGATGQAPPARRHQPGTTGQGEGPCLPSPQ